MGIKRLTAVSAGRFYRVEHIVAYSSGKVVAKSWMENSIVLGACCFMRTEKKRTNGLAQIELKEKPIQSQFNL